MKNLNKVLIVAAAIVSVVAIISRLTITPVSGVESRAMAGLAALLLLFAIALEGLK
jgi:hypothetical protein